MFSGRKFRDHMEKVFTTHAMMVRVLDARLVGFSHTLLANFHYFPAGLAAPLVCLKRGVG